MEVKSNIICIPKLRVDKTNTFYDDIRVMIIGILICLFFIIIPFYISNKFNESSTYEILIQPKE